MEIIFANPLVWAAPFLITLLVFEFIYSKMRGNKNIYKWKDFISSTAMGLGVVIIKPLIKIISTAAIFYFVYEIFNPVINDVRTNIFGYKSFGWVWYIWIICLVLSDFSHYWFHRLNHTVRIMWAAHIVHHSSEHYNFGTALRLSWFAMIYKPLFYMWIAMIGFHPEMMLVCLGIEAIWQFLLHTSYCPKLKFLELFLITPKQHEVHHATNVQYLDKNHGAILNVFDRIFGSWKGYDKSIKITYGVTHSPNSHNPLIIATHEYISIWKDVKGSNSLYEIFMNIFGPPGWSIDGKTLTVKQLQGAYKMNNYKDTIDWI